MYLSHFQLHEKPFKISTDPKFLWMGERHKEALETLKYGILYNDGYVVVTGDVGTGKTTLANALVHDLRNKVTIARMSFPDVDTLDFLRLILTTFEINERIETRGSFLAHFQSFLHGSFASERKAVLVVDEAQRLTHGNLEELQRLSSMEENGTPLLTLVFVGQNEFNDLLVEESNRALRQRVAINYNLLGLTEVETGQYISYRLNVARCEREIFAPEAVQEVFLFSGGIPRLINIVCDLALLMAYYEKRENVVPETIKHCLERLRLPNEKADRPRSESDHSTRIEEKVENDNDEKAEEAPEEKRRKPVRMKVIFAAGMVLLIAILGLLLFFYRPGKVQQNWTSEATGKDALSQDRSALESPPLTKSPDSSHQKSEEVMAPAEPQVEHQVEPQAVPQVVPQVVPQAVPLQVPSQVSPQVPYEKPPAKKTDGHKTSVAGKPPKGKTPSEEKGETRGETRSGSIRETPVMRAEEVEHSEVIDWLLERRPNKD